MEFGNGKDVVFLHGWGADLRAFLFVARELNCRSVLVDFYGFGKTPHPDFPLTVADYANGVIEVLNKCNIKKAVLVGHSFGGRVAIEIASKFPNLVEKLVLIDSAGIKPRRKLKYYFKILLHKILKRFGKGQKGSADYCQLSNVMKKTFINVVNYNQKPLLKFISADTAIFWGTLDEDTPLYMARILNKKIKSSHLFLLTNAGHFSYLDSRVEFLAILKAFLRG
ncbi:MAG: alpha/beta hydrolase [Clostridia bacterium]